MTLFRDMAFGGLGACIILAGWILLETGEEPARWQKTVIIGAGERSPRLQWYIGTDKNEYINCTRDVYATVIDNLRENKEPPAYWCLLSPATWKHPKPYIWKVEPAVNGR